MASPREIIVPLSTGSCTPATQIRGTLLVSSLRALREHGFYERYLGLASPELRARVPEIIAGQWLPMAVGLHHYAACDALQLTVGEQLSMGAFVADGILKTLLGTVLRAARGSGVTPWMGLRLFDRIYARCFQGGGTSVTKVGPKDAHIEVVNLPVARFGYFRNAYVGLIRAGSEIFGFKSYVSVAHSGNPERSLVFRYAWV